jgi:hypothetical protein
METGPHNEMRANAGIFPDNNPFSIPSSNRKRYRYLKRKRRLTTKNLRNSSKYIKIVKSLSGIIVRKKKSNPFSELLTYWQIGEQIARVTSERDESKSFNKKLFILLAVDCKIKITDINRAVKFYRTFPILSDLSPDLTFKHYLILMDVESDKSRESFHKRSIDEKLSIEELKKLIIQ